MFQVADPGPHPSPVTPPIDAGEGCPDPAAVCARLGEAIREATEAFERIGEAFERMTQILLHPTPASGRIYTPSLGPVLLQPPWMWWETRAVPNDLGNIMQIRQESSEGPIAHGEYVVTIDRDGDEVILTDPPAMHLLQVTIYDDRLWMESQRTILESCYLLARVVWHEQPGPRWRPVPGRMVCTPGEYIHDSQTQPANGRSGRCDTARDYQRYEIRHPSMPLLDWPITPTIRTAPVLTPNEIRELEGFRELEGTRVTWGGEPMHIRTDHPPRDDICAACGGQLVLTNDRDHLICLPCGAITERVTRRAGTRKAVRGPSILPESQVVDDIDRLVNDSIRPGPRDDYSVDRYPRCKDCAHSWHGLECEACDCLNTTWLEDGNAK